LIHQKERSAGMGEQTYLRGRSFPSRGKKRKKASGRQGTVTPRPGPKRRRSSLERFSSRASVVWDLTQKRGEYPWGLKNTDLRLTYVIWEGRSEPSDNTEKRLALARKRRLKGIGQKSTRGKVPQKLGTKSPGTGRPSKRSEKDEIKKSPL